METCPVCKTNATTENGHPFYYDCPICGEYKIDRITKAYLNSLLDTEEKKILLTNSIRKAQDKNKEPLLLSIEFVRKVTEEPFPSPQIQMKNFILWLGDKTKVFGKTINASISIIQLEMVSVSIDAAKHLTNYLQKEGLIIASILAGSWDEETYTLSLDVNGWRIYQELKFLSDTSDTGKLLRHLYDSQTSPYGDPEEIMETFSWNADQFNKAFLLLKDSQLIDALYADDKPNTVFITDKGLDMVKIAITPPPSFFVGGNVNKSNIISGNNNTIINYTKHTDEEK